MYKSSDAEREFTLSEDKPETVNEYRSPYRRDYARLIHCPAFRRLQGKTQLYPGLESDFFRNRLTHSLEVAQIAKSIALSLNHSILESGGKDVQKNGLSINPDICEFAGLAHDLGHPPFGHQGEEALDELMRDSGGFEGNAQTLRILSRIEKKSREDLIIPDTEFRHGLNLTFRSLASILKYDRMIPSTNAERPPEWKGRAMKGYYKSEEEVVQRIKVAVASEEYTGKFKTVECQIMDIADDIAYSTYDLEDGFKAGFYHPLEFFNYPEIVYQNVAIKVNNALSIKLTSEDIKEELRKIFIEIYEFDFSALAQTKDSEGLEYYAIPKQEIAPLMSTLVNQANATSRNIARDGFIRNAFTSQLVNQAIAGITIENFEGPYPAMAVVKLKSEIAIIVEILKNFTYESQILSSRLKVAEYRGKEIVKEIFKALVEDEGWRLMPDDIGNYMRTIKPKTGKKGLFVIL